MGGETARPQPSRGMARRARAECDGAIYHVTQRGNAGQAIFDGDYERRFFLEQLEITAVRYDWRSLAYCLMSNHYHLVIETRAPSLGDGMRRFGSVHAQVFNRGRATYGHVFQERYGSVLVRTDAQFAQLLRYVALNPVAARLCTDPRAWPWCSHRSMLASGGGATARARVEELLEPWGGSPGGRYTKLFAAPDVSATRLADPDAVHRPSLEALLSLTPRDDAIRAALDYGYHQTQVAEVFGVNQSTVSRWLRPGGVAREVPRGPGRQGAG
jgi:REP element-mobilizing transposase RayT